MMSSSMPPIGEQPEDPGHPTGGDSLNSSTGSLRWNTVSVQNRGKGLFVSKSLRGSITQSAPILPGTTPSNARRFTSMEKEQQAKLKKKKLKKIKINKIESFRDEKTGKFTKLSNAIISGLPLHHQDDIRALTEMILSRCSEVEAKATAAHQKFLSQEKERLTWMQLANEKQRNMVLLQKEMAVIEKKCQGLTSDLAKATGVVNKQRRALGALGARNDNLSDVVAALVDPPSQEGGLMGGGGGGAGGAGGGGDFRDQSLKFQALLREGAINSYTGVTHQRRKIQTSMASLTKEKDDLVRGLKNAEEKGNAYKRRAKQATQKMRQMQGELEEAKALLEAYGAGSPVVPASAAAAAAAAGGVDAAAPASPAAAVAAPEKPGVAGGGGDRGSGGAAAAKPPAPLQQRLPPPKRMHLERTKSGFKEIQDVSARLSQLLQKGTYDVMELFSDFEQVQNLNLTLASAADSAEGLLARAVAGRALRLVGAAAAAAYVVLKSRPGELGVLSSHAREASFVPAGRGLVGAATTHGRVTRMVNPRRPQDYDPEVDDAAWGLEAASAEGDGGGGGAAAAAAPVRAMMVLPLLDPATDRPVGALAFCKRDAAELFTEVDEVLASVLAAQLGASLVHAQETAAARRRARDLVKVLELGPAVLRDATANPDLAGGGGPEGEGGGGGGGGGAVDLARAVRGVEAGVRDLLQARACRLFVHEDPLAAGGSGQLWHLEQEVSERGDLRTTWERRYSRADQGLAGAVLASGAGCHHPQGADHLPEYSAALDLPSDGRPLTAVPLRNFLGQVVAVLEVCGYAGPTRGASAASAASPFLDLGAPRRRPYQLEALQWAAARLADPLDRLLRQAGSGLGGSAAGAAAGAWGGSGSGGGGGATTEAALRAAAAGLRREKQAAEAALAEAAARHAAEAAGLRRALADLQAKVATARRSVADAGAERAAAAAQAQARAEELRAAAAAAEAERAKALADLKKVRASKVEMLEANQRLIEDLQAQRDAAQEAKFLAEDALEKARARIATYESDAKESSEELKAERGSVRAAEAARAAAERRLEDLLGSQLAHEDRTGDLAAQVEGERARAAAAEGRERAAAAAAKEGERARLQLARERDELRARLEAERAASEKLRKELALYAEKVQQQALLSARGGLATGGGRRRSSRSPNRSRQGSRAAAPGDPPLPTSARPRSRENSGGGGGNSGGGAAAAAAAAAPPSPSRRSGRVAELEAELAAARREAEALRAELARGREGAAGGGGRGGGEEGAAAGAEGGGGAAARPRSERDEELIGLLREELEAARGEAAALRRREGAGPGAAGGDQSSVQTKDLEAEVASLQEQKAKLSKELQLMSQDKEAIENATRELEEKKSKHEEDKTHLQKLIDEEKAKAEAAKQKLLEEKKQHEEEKARLEGEKMAHEEEKRKLQALMSSTDPQPQPSADEGVAAAVAGRAEEEAAAPHPAAPDSFSVVAMLKKWEKMTDEEGNTYYLNQETGESQWEEPEDLSARAAAAPAAAEKEEAAAAGGGGGEWTKQLHTDGSTYFVHSVTGETSWYDPNDPDAAAAAASAHETGDDAGSLQKQYSIEL